MVKLPPDMLLRVTKPARYTGNEWNEIKKEHSGVKCLFALAMPDIYEVGMSNLGLKILYEILNRDSDIAAERVYAPWIDMEREMRDHNIPLYALESFEEISKFDFIGFTLQHEMSYTNVLNMLDLANIPVMSAERAEDAPFVVGGGPCVYNVEPLTDFFDLFLVGEGEEAILELSHAYIAWKEEGRPGGRRGFLLRAACIDGFYVPSLYEPHYDENGIFTHIEPLVEEAKPIVYKRIVKEFDKAAAADHPVVPYINIVHNRIMLELFRGCSRGCRFCQAGICYRPVRERKADTLRDEARNMIDSTGYDEMSLTSLSSADYSCLGNLVDDLMYDFRHEKVSFSLPSLRIDSFSVELAHKMQQIRKSGLTFAPEAGTQRLRDVINKGVTEEDLMTSVKAAFRQGWKQVKPYFMMGLPTETDEDVIGIAKLAEKVLDAYQEIHGKRGAKVTVSVSCFVPKPYTPFQWFGQVSMEEFERRQRLLKEHITDRSIRFNYHDAKTSTLEGVLARGDRRLNKLIYAAWKNGAKFDSWTDEFNEDAWRDAFAKTGIDPHDYNQRERGDDEAFPWEHTSPGVYRSFLEKERNKAREARLTHDCRRSTCTGCGICPTLEAHVIDWKVKNDCE